MGGCDISKLDLCKHSVTLSDKHKALANHQYRSYLLALQQAANEFDLPKNIYLGGSLALQEPALLFSGVQCQGVYSDLDLFVIAESLTDIPVLMPLPYQIEGVMPELERSFHYAPLVKAQAELHIVTLEDLSLGMAHPVVEEITVDYDEYKIPGHSRSMAKMLVARLCAYCLPYRNTSHLYTNQQDNRIKRSPMDTIKLVLSCLRLQCYGKIENAQRVSALVTLAEKGLFSALIDKKMVVEWVKCREQYNPEQVLPPLALPEFIYKAWCAGVDIPPGSSVDKLLDAVSSTYFYQPQVLDGLARVLLSLCFYKLAPDWERLHLLEEQLLAFMQQKAETSEEFLLCKQIKCALASHVPVETLVVQLFNRYMQLTTESVVGSEKANDS